jgi:bacterioferritin
MDGSRLDDLPPPLSADLERRRIMNTRETESQEITREKLIELLNEDLAREYQAIISYVIYSQVLKGAQYMKIAAELEIHAGEELSHAIMIAKQIDYLGGMPVTAPKQVRTSEKAEDMLRFDLENETETIKHYRRRVRQCEALGEFALAEHLREILMEEQDHQIALATALGIDVPHVGDASAPPSEKTAGKATGKTTEKSPEKSTEKSADRFPDKGRKMAVPVSRRNGM